jgi:uncharacterized repeat protein (TIGR01451 family)
MVYGEDFENTASALTGLADYRSGSGVEYGADPYWLNPARCNGFIVTRDAVQPTGYCNDAPAEWTSLTSKVDALAQLAGGDPGSNHALATNTSGGDPTLDENVMFRTATPIQLPVANRFLALAADFAASSTTCRGNVSPVLSFSLMDGTGAEHVITGDPIDVYQDPRGQEFTGTGADGGTRCVVAGSFLSRSSLLITGDSVGLVLRNLALSPGEGNDGALDNVLLLDVTPQLDKSFSPQSVPAGDVSTLTLTVTNTAEVAAKEGWAFADTLPDGLVLADPAHVGGTCSADVAAPAGGSRIAVTDGVLASGEVACTITVDVTASPSPATPSPVTYANCAANITDMAGIDAPACTSVEFTRAPGVSLVKSSRVVDVNGNRVTDRSDEIWYSFDLANTGTTLLTDVAVDDPMLTRAGISVTCDPATLAPGDTVTCSAGTAYVIAQADVDAGAVTNTATGTGRSPDGTVVRSGPDGRVVRISRTPGPAVVNAGDREVVVVYHRGSDRPTLRAPGVTAPGPTVQSGGRTAGPAVTYGLALGAAALLLATAAAVTAAARRRAD